ncbi:hemolysin family protein [Candidatus Magnetomonas plexicatena]|uniref:hemolysin family protein n=1 Tax=Candidatus Magnetomonas plexicatena TaxID=2552947 RepID=UPI001C7928A6|nr:HlyC/CorC family transporter [Nitrospirales bacterium LBB_01]
MWIEILLVLVFIVFSGFFASAEIAVVTSRKARIEAYAKEGSGSAKTLLTLIENPNRFLATVQVGVTIGGAVASALGGVLAIKALKPVIAGVPVQIISGWAEPLSIGMVICATSYLTLILGELVPKSIALMFPEKVALFLAKPIATFSKLSAIVVNILAASTNLLLKPFGKTAFMDRALISHEEIKLLIKEGKERGIFDLAEQELIHSVFEFTDISVKEVMVPTGQVVALSLDDPLTDVLFRIYEEQYSRYPVYSKEINNILGIIHTKDVCNMLSKHREINLRKLLRPPFYVPETLMISTLLADMRRKRMHMAIAVNEHGLVTGIVTIEDLLEEIVGEIRDEHDTEQPVIELGNSTYIVYASINIRDLKDDYEIELPESPQYDTLAGFVLTTLQKIPKSGETIELPDMKLTVVEVVHTRVAKVKIELIKNQEVIDETVPQIE